LPEQHLRLDAEKGEYYDVLFDSPAIIMGLFMYRAWHEKLYKVFETGASTILFEIGRELGIYGFQKLKEKVENPLEVASAGMKHGFSLGWGKMSMSKAQLLKMATLKSMTVKIEDCFIPKAIGNTGQTSCHLLRGFFVGALETMTGRKCSCEETKCIARGDPHCEFQLKQIQQTP